VKDINPGPGGSSPFGFTVLNNALYFSADDGTNGFELWRSDSTEAGTVRVGEKIRSIAAIQEQAKHPGR